MFNVPIYECTQVGEVNQGRSEVIPNQALHIREILQRSARGQYLPEVQANTLEYGPDEDEDGQDLFLPTDDKFEIYDKLSYYEARILEMKKAQKQAQEAKKAKEPERSEGDEAKESENA